MNLGENIYKNRTAKNWSQSDLAEALDVSRQSVSKWENNAAMPDLDKLMKMREIFEITLDELVYGRPEGNDTSDDPSDNSKAPHISEHFDKLSEAFEELGATRKVSFGDAECILCEAEKIFEIYGKILKCEANCVIEREVIPKSWWKVE